MEKKKIMEFMGKCGAICGYEGQRGAILVPAKLRLHMERSNPINLQYKHFFKLREDFMCTLNDIKFMILSVPLQDIELRVQDVETKGNPVNTTAFSY